MESRRLTRRQVQHLGADPTTEVVFRTAKKPTAKKSNRKPLADKTNDSPILGLVPATPKAGKLCCVEKSPSSKLRKCPKSSPMTPGEELLRTQVQSLLSKVDNEGSKKTNLHALLSEYCPSPGGLEAPTPANTPADLSSSMRLSTIASQFRIPLAPFEEEAAYVASEVPESVEGRQCEEDEELLPLDLQLLCMFAKASKAPAAAAQDTIPDALDHDSLEHFQQVLYKVREENDSDVDDTVSECSLAVNVSSPGANRSLRPTPEKSCLNESAVVAPQWQQRSTPRKVKVQEEQSQEYETYEDNDDYDYYGEEDADVHPEFDELCNAISNISMNEDGKVGLPAFEGRHVRFNYNSDDELESEVVDASTPQGPPTPEILRLKGLPTPKGKHLRFTEEE